jgi:hypothetical protein
MEIQYSYSPTVKRLICFTNSYFQGLPKQNNGAMCMCDDAARLNTVKTYLIIFYTSCWINCIISYKLYQILIGKKKGGLQRCTNARHFGTGTIRHQDTSTPGQFGTCIFFFDFEHKTFNYGNTIFLFASIISYKLYQYFFDYNTYESGFESLSKFPQIFNL